MCPPCQWAWPSLPGSEAVQQLARERVGCAVYGLGFRLRPDTQRVVHRAKYGGFPGDGRALGHWMAHAPRGVVLGAVAWRRLYAVAEGGLATGWGLEVQPKLLRRLKHRVSLTSATRAARQSALRGAFGLREDCRTALGRRCGAGRRRLDDGGDVSGLSTGARGRGRGGRRWGVAGHGVMRLEGWGSVVGSGERCTFGLWLGTFPLT